MLGRHLQAVVRKSLLLHRILLLGLLALVLPMVRLFLGFLLLYRESVVLRAADGLAKVSLAQAAARQLFRTL